LAVIVAAATVGCAASTESRMRDLFAIADSVEVDTLAARRAILRDLPLGTSRDSVLAVLAARGVGKRAHTSQHWYLPDSVLIVNVSLDPRRLAIVQAEYGVEFTFARTSGLRDVQVSRAFTGP
jgi:hypothetical protein